MKVFRRIWRVLWHVEWVPGGAPSLDVVLADASPTKSTEARIQWLCNLLAWVRRRPESIADALEDVGRLQNSRVRLLLQILDRTPDLREKVSATLFSILRDTSALDLFCETGLPNEHGLLREIWIRIESRVLPPLAYTGDLGLLFDRLFPQDDDEAWIKRLEESTLQRLADLIRQGAKADESPWHLLHLDMEESLIQLAAQVRIAGSSQEIRSRIPGKHFRELPFFKLTSSVDAVVSRHRQDPDTPPTAELTHLHLQMDKCHEAIDTAFTQLEEFGVNTAIVYQLDRMRAQLHRIRDLVELLLDRSLPFSRIAGFVASLIRDHQSRQGVPSLISANWELLTRKLVERAAEAGENYIARDWKQYWNMFRSALGGGAIMGIATWMKLGLTSFAFPSLIQGFLLSFNYAGHFLAIQFSGSSLATKQPATTAPALAARLKNVREPESLEKLVDEIAALIRSQAAAITGNLLLTAPTALFVAWLGSLLTNQPLLSEARATQMMDSLSLLSMTPIYAALTGVALWISSLLGALADNWYALHRLQIGLRQSPRLNFLFNPAGARRIADFFDRHLAGLTSNIALALFLGLMPVLGSITGLPIDIRHVTIAAGQLAAAAYTAGEAVLISSPFWWAVTGVASVGFINVLVSFALAFFVATRARDIEATQRSSIYRAVRKRLFRRPFSFIFPPRPRRPDKGSAKGGDGILPS